VPDGTPVIWQDDGASGVKYVWKQGKAVPYVDIPTMTSIQQEIAKLQNEGRATALPTGQASPASTPSAMNFVIQSDSSAVFTYFTIGAMAGGCILLATAIWLLLPRKGSTP
jgi:hypothetical protein